jgi:subtilase family serine protease
MTARCALALMIVFSSACSGGQGAYAPPIAPSISQPVLVSGASGEALWGATSLQGAHYLGPANVSALSAEIAITPQNGAALVAYAKEVSDPRSASYRKFLTPADIGNRFGASPASYAAAAAHFASFGLRVGGWPQRLSLYLSGSRTRMERALGTHFGLYQRGDETFIAPTGPPSLPSSLGIAAILGVVRSRDMRSALVGPTNGLLLGYAPQQLARAFGDTAAYGQGDDGSGVTIAIVGTGPLDAAHDNTYFASMFTAQMAAVQPMPVTDGGVSTALSGQGSAGPALPSALGLATPPPVTAPGCQGKLPSCNPEDGEAQLDTQVTASLASGAQVLYYLAYDPGSCAPTATDSECTSGVPSPAQGLDLVDEEIQQIIADDKADIVSMSFGEGEALAMGAYFDGSGQGFGPTELAALAAEGVAVFVASGDDGAFGCGYTGVPAFESMKCTQYPASDPDVTAVGGVTAPLGAAGDLSGAITAWGFQTTSGGNGTFMNNVGSGGGTSMVFAAPSWQQGEAVVGQAALTNRGVPDVALDADPNTGVTIVMNAAFPGSTVVGAAGGTSLSAPQMAATWALVLQACYTRGTCGATVSGHPYRLGNAAPLLYATASSALYNVTYGSNGTTSSNGFQAGSGYSLVTGLGVPFPLPLINSIAKN